MKLEFIFRAIIAATVAVAGMQAAVARADSNAPPAQNCIKLLSADFSRIPEAPTQVLGANLVEAKDNVPAYCSVKGVVTPRVGFDLKMPVENWNGKFFQAGCGNWCGVIYPKACDDPLRRGYACIETDSGHKAPTQDPFMTDGQWAYNNLEAELDWGGRATHVTAVAGKAITESFYNNAPKKAYFMGCSYGGHQAMVLAQRFPFDFDGIVGGGAPNNIGDLMQQNAWAITHGFDANLKSVFSEDDIKVLHGAALARCDLDDGIKDGLVTNPRACKVNPDDLVCKSGQTSNCLSQKSADAAKKMYSGAINSKGESLSLTPGSWTPGSEIDWRNIYRSDGKGLVALADNYFRYMGRQPDLGPEWQLKDYDFDRDYRRNDVMETMYSASNPDLRRFKHAGGKFINYVGWNDLGTVPDKAIDYYETTQKTMGGRDQTAEFFRMFMIPGARHCRGGPGPYEVDFLTYIETWVEQGKAPDVMVGKHPKEGGGTELTRPIYAYPNHAKYQGSGDPNDVANYKSVTPR